MENVYSYYGHDDYLGNVLLYDTIIVIIVLHMIYDMYNVRAAAVRVYYMTICIVHCYGGHGGCT